MTTAKSRNLLIREQDPSEDTIEGGLAGYSPTREPKEHDFEKTGKRRDPWFIRLFNTFPIRRRLAGTGSWRVILKVSLIFGCTWLGIWTFRTSAIFPLLPLAVRYLCRSRAAYDIFSHINIGGPSTNRPASST